MYLARLEFGSPKVQHLVNKVGYVRRREALLLQPLFDNCPMVDRRLIHVLKVSGGNMLKLPSRPNKFHLSKSNTLNIRRFIPIKVILHNNYPITKSGGMCLTIICGYIDADLSDNVRVTLICVPTTSSVELILNDIISVLESLIVLTSRLPIVTKPFGLSRFVKPMMCIPPNVMSEDLDRSYVGDFSEARVRRSTLDSS